MSKTQSITIRKGLSIYKQPKSKGKGSPNWYARVYREFGGRSVHTKSTGTTDEKVARSIAEQHWTDCLLSSRHSQGIGEIPANFKSNVVRFDRVADAFLDNLQRGSGQDATSQRNLADYRGAVHSKSGFVRFFGKDDVKNITTDRINEYLEYQRANSRKGTLAATSQKRSLVLLNVILKFAVQKRWLDYAPLQPKLRIKDTPRAWFEKSEYLKLMSTARSLAGKANREKDADSEKKWLELNDFIMFMMNTFLRPSEWATLQQKHITAISGEGRRLEICVIKGKTGLRTSYSMQRGVTVYERMLERAGKSPDAYIFKGQYLNRQTAMERMRDDSRSFCKLPR